MVGDLDKLMALDTGRGSKEPRSDADLNGGQKLTQAMMQNSGKARPAGVFVECRGLSSRHVVLQIMGVFSLLVP